MVDNIINDINRSVNITHGIDRAKGVYPRSFKAGSKNYVLWMDIHRGPYINMVHSFLQREHAGMYAKYAFNPLVAYCVHLGLLDQLRIEDYAPLLCFKDLSQDNIYEMTGLSLIRNNNTGRYHRILTAGDDHINYPKLLEVVSSRSYPFSPVFPISTDTAYVLSDYNTALLFIKNNYDKILTGLRTSARKVSDESL